jgi:hypothetical protein
VTAPTFFEQALADYRKGLEWREHYDDFIDSLGPRAGICAEDAAAEYADETMEEAERADLDPKELPNGRFQVAA